MIMARNEDGTYSQVGFVKDNAGIDTEYIYDKDGDIVFEKGFTRETSGTVPLTINGIGKDLKAWSITGNTVQNGTPTPENPVEVQAVGDRTGNLFDYSTIRTGYRIAWATGADYADNTAMMSDYIKVKNTTYSCSDKAMIICYDGNKNYLGALNKSMVVEKEVGIFCDMFTINDNECKFIKLLTYQGFVIGNKTMLNEGSTPLPYEPYGYKIPVVTRGKNLFNCNDKPTLSKLTKMYTISNLDINKYYTCSTSFEKIPEVPLASLYFAGESSLKNGVWKDTPRTFKPDTNGQIAVYVRHATSEGAPAIFDKVISGEITIMVEEDSTATPYEPYHEPITTPIYLPTPLYSGEVMRSDGSREVKWGVEKIKDLGFSYESQYSRFKSRAIPNNSFKDSSRLIIAYSDIYECLYNGEEFDISWTNKFYIGSSNDSITIYIHDTRFNNLNNFISLVGEHEIYYPTEPTTEAFTAPQIPTLNGTTVIDVDTAVKPTEMYTKYKSSK